MIWRAVGAPPAVGAQALDSRGRRWTVVAQQPFTAVDRAGHVRLLPEVLVTVEGGAPRWYPSVWWVGFAGEAYA